MFHIHRELFDINLQAFCNGFDNPIIGLMDDEMIHIKALIICERDSQKGIIIGHRGQALKKVGAMARKDIERFFEKKVEETGLL